MVRYLIKRPIAVLLLFISLLVSGTILFGKIPVSLLPEIDIPRIIIHVEYPDNSSAVIENRIIDPIRQTLATLTGLKSIESKSSDHTGILYLDFEYGTRMNLAYIEVSEKIDRLTTQLPQGIKRPQILKVNTSDIPVIRIQVTPKSTEMAAEVSLLTDKILRKRLEQVPGVSIVDINGIQKSVIDIVVNQESLEALKLESFDIAKAVQSANQKINGLTVKDGQYRYFVNVENAMANLNDISNLLIPTREKTFVPLKQIAHLSLENEVESGFHLLNGKKGIVITIQKQAESKMNELVPAIKDLVNDFVEDYPKVNFSFTQDQTFLLDAGISNLYQDIIYGGILTILLLFLFLKNLTSILILSLNIPISLIISFIFFYLFNVTFNIISLSGLALGIGMLIDNSIVVVDSIIRKRKDGDTHNRSIVNGTNEVITPVISQVLTTIAVYAPLILLNGMPRSLVMDQSIALTISLLVSLCVAFILSPILFKVLSKKNSNKIERTETRAYQAISERYHMMIDHILKKKLFYFSITLVLMPIGILIAFTLPITSLPDTEKTESLLVVDWGSSIDATENLSRTKKLQELIQTSCFITEAEVGIQQFLLQQENNDIKKMQIYYLCKDEKIKKDVDEKVRRFFSRFYPESSLQIFDSPNAFTQLFNRKKSFLEIKFRPANSVKTFENYTYITSQLKKIPNLSFRLGDGMLSEVSVMFRLNTEKMIILGVDRDQIRKKLEELFSRSLVTDLKNFGDQTTVQMISDAADTERRIFLTHVRGQNGTNYYLNEFVNFYYNTQPRFITGDLAGRYESVILDRFNGDIEKLAQKVQTISGNVGYKADISGAYFNDLEQLKTLWLIFLIVLLLVYLILAIQYEDLVLPFIVMLTIPLGITGGLFCLWATGATLNVMAAIGLIVVLGLIVDDPTLKIEVLNRLLKKYSNEGYLLDDLLLKKIIHEAGEICLKPLLLVSLTTSIALVPVLFVSGLGNDLQKPMAIVIIGGLTIGTFFTTWFIPLAYWHYTKFKNKIINVNS